MSPAPALDRRPHRSRARADHRRDDVTLRDDMARAPSHRLIERIAAFLEEVHTLQQQLEHRQDAKESASGEAERLFQFAIAAALEAGLVKTMEEVLVILRHASQPLGPMGAEWLESQEQKLKGQDERRWPMPFLITAG